MVNVLIVREMCDIEISSFLLKTPFTQTLKISLFSSKPLPFNISWDYQVSQTNFSLNFNCLFLARIISILIVTIFSKATSLITCQVYGILSVLLLNLISMASSFNLSLNRWSSIHYNIGRRILRYSSILFFRNLYFW